jgi:hypothetical protein
MLIVSDRYGPFLKKMLLGIGAISRVYYHTKRV